MSARNGVRVGILGLIIAAAMVVPGVAMAADFNVNTTADGDDKECAQDCTLREAVSLAGTNDRVVVPAGTYALTMGELFLVADEVVGAGARTTLIDGSGNSRVMRIADGTSTVSGVTIARGNGASTFASGAGGGIFVMSGAALQLLNSTVRNNTAEQGGGIAAVGTVVLSASTVTANTASFLRQATGGGIYSTFALGLVNSTVSGNTATDPGNGSQGGGVASAGQLIVSFSTIANNSAANGGLFVVQPQTGSFGIANSVIDGGTGGACAGSGVSALTATSNVVDDGSCQFKDPSNRQDVNTALGPLANNGGTTDTHALLPASAAINAAGTCTTQDQRGVTRPQTGTACDSGSYEYRAPTLRVTTTVTNTDGGTRVPADFTVHVRQGGTDVKGSPQAGSVEGSTYTLDAGATYAVAADAVAGYTITVGGDCTAAGSVTLAEGQNRTCTITANDVAPKLTVVTQVVNDHGGTATPASFSVHVRKGGADVAGSPQPGAASGTVHTLTAGAYSVSADAVGGYTTTTSGDCAPALAVGDSRTCTITADDDAPPVRGQATGQLPPPEPGKTINALPRSGTVKVKLPGAKAYIALDEAQQLPVGTVVDARKGHVTLVAAADDKGGTATAEFWAGIFRLGQTRGSAPITTLTLVEKLSCPKRGKASTAAKRKKKRRLWGDGKGRFRTEGEFSSATVRGTRWLVEDRCTSTLTRVLRGRVAVRDKVKRKTVIVRAGKKYVATAKR